MLEIRTPNPHGLVEEINKAIKCGKIFTWSVDSDGDYTHSLDRWKNRAWLRCKFDDSESNLLRLVIIESREIKLSKAIYGFYHCRFAEMLLTNFDTEIKSIKISPLLTQFDIYSKDE